MYIFINCSKSVCFTIVYYICFILSAYIYAFSFCNTYRSFIRYTFVIPLHYIANISNNFEIYCIYNFSVWNNIFFLLSFFLNLITQIYKIYICENIFNFLYWFYTFWRCLQTNWPHCFSIVYSFLLSASAYVTLKYIASCT